MRSVDFEHAEAGLGRARGSGGKACHHVGNLGLGHGVRRWPGRADRLGRRAGSSPGRRPGCCIRRIERQPGAPRRSCGRLAAGVRDLDRRHRAQRRDRFDDRAIGLHLRVVPDAAAAVRDASLRDHRRCFGEDEPDPAAREGGQMREVEGVGEAVLGRIHAERREDDAVRQRHRAQFDGLKQQRQGQGDDPSGRGK